MSKPYSAAELDAVERTWAEGWLPVKHPDNCPCEHHRLIATVRAAWEDETAHVRDQMREDLRRYTEDVAALKVEVARLRGMVRSGINGLGAPYYGGRERRALAERLQDALAASGEREEAGR